MDQQQKLDLVLSSVRLGKFSAGKLSSALGNPEDWRPVIEQAEAEGLIKAEDGRLVVAEQAPVWAEEAEARADAMRFVDSHQPFALAGPVLETPPLSGNPEALVTLSTPQEAPGATLSAVQEPKRARRTPEQIAADKASRELEREQKKLERAAARELAKAQRAQERVQAKLDAKAAKITEAEGGYVELPAVVLRDGTVRHVSDSDAWAVISMYLDDLMIDVETSGFPLGHQFYALKTVQLGGEHAAIVFDERDQNQMDIAALGLSMAKRVHAHSATADAIPCVARGLIGWDDIWGKMYDSVLNAKLTDPAMSGSDADALKELAADLLREYAVSPNAEKAKNELFKAMGCLTKTDLTTPIERNGWYQVNRNSVVMTRYAGSDVLDLAAVLRVLPPLPVAESVLDREREFQAACAPITYTGFKLDHEHIKAKIAEEETARDEAQRNVLTLSDGKITNPKSPDVIKLLPEVIPGLVLPVHPKTKKPTADKGALEKLAVTEDPLTHHLCKEILRYRRCDTALGLLLRPFDNLCEYGDGRGRTTIYTIEASTGRTSSRRFNAQQLSRQGGVRKCIVADEGYRGISADFSGCEIKVAAALSGDAGLLEAETSPKCYLHDAEGCCEKPHTGLHWLAAHLTFGNDATKEDRYKCKGVIFRKLFGGAPDSPVAQKIADVFDTEIAPVYHSWDQWLRQCYKEGSMVWRDYSTGTNYSQPVEGNRRMVYKAYSGRHIYISNGEHAAGNGAIQGTARELLVDGVLNWKKTRWGGGPLLPVHDEIIAMVREQEAAEAALELQRCMATSVLSSPGFEVRISADVDQPWLFWKDSS